MAIACTYAATLAALLVLGGKAASLEGQIGGWILHVLVLVAPASLGVVLLGRGGWRAALGGRASALDLWLGVGAGLLALGVSFSYVAALSALLETDGAAGEALPSWWPWVDTVLTPALLEEWLCRGVLFEATRRVAGPRTTVLLTSALFALLHGLGGGFLLEVPHRLFAGLLFGWLRLRSGSLMPGVFGHLTVNGLVVLLLDD